MFDDKKYQVLLQNIISNKSYSVELEEYKTLVCVSMEDSV